MLKVNQRVRWMVLNWNKGVFLVSDDISLIDLDIVLKMLSDTYWASDRMIETIEKSIKNSISFGLYHGAKRL